MKQASIMLRSNLEAPVGGGSGTRGTGTLELQGAFRGLRGSRLGRVPYTFADAWLLLLWNSVQSFNFINNSGSL